MKTIKILISSLLILNLFSCSHSPIADLEYKENNLYSSSNSGNVKYDDMGPVTSNQSGFAWESCRVIAATAIKELVAQAKAKGGNAVVNVTWLKGDMATPIPHCTNRWGWWFAYVVGGLGPWMKNVEVYGTAAKIDGKIAPNTNVYLFDPKNDNYEIAQNILSKINNL